MNGANLTAKIYHGYAMAAGKVGTAHQQFRSASAINPLSGTAFGSMNAAFSVGGNLNNQSNADQIFWQAIADGSQLQIGDYLAGLHTWCIVGMEPLMPVIAMRCTDSISISRGAETFSANDGLSQTVTVIASGIPCYIQLKRDKGFSAPAGMPAPTNTSAPMPEWLVYIGLGGVTPDGFIHEGDLIQDQNGNQWKVDAASNSTLSWQLACTPYRPNA